MEAAARKIEKEIAAALKPCAGEAVVNISPETSKRILNAGYEPERLGPVTLFRLGDDGEFQKLLPKWHPNIEGDASVFTNEDGDPKYVDIHYRFLHLDDMDDGFDRRDIIYFDHRQIVYFETAFGVREKDVFVVAIVPKKWYRSC